MTDWVSDNGMSADETLQHFAALQPEATTGPGRTCSACGAELHANEGAFPQRGPWLDSINWSVCDWTYRQHTPKDDNDSTTAAG